MTLRLFKINIPLVQLRSHKYQIETKKSVIAYIYLQHLHNREGLTANNFPSLPSALNDVNIGLVVTRSAIQSAS